jgi:hypothetical protein
MVRARCGKWALLSFALVAGFIFAGCGGGGGSNPNLPLPPDYEAIRASESGGAEILATLLGEGKSNEEALAAVAEWVQAQAAVQLCIHHADQQCVWIRFHSGPAAVIGILEEETERPSQAAPPVAPVTTDFVVPADGKGMWIDPFGFDEGVPETEIFRGHLKPYGYTWKELNGDVIDFARIPEYSIVHINTHSAKWSQDGQTPILLTGEVIPDVEQEGAFATQQWLKGIVVHVHACDEQGRNCIRRYAITTEFATNFPNYKQGQILILQACYSCPEFTNAFRQAGVTTVLGFDSKIHFEYARYMLWKAFRDTCPLDPQGAPVTLQEAGKPDDMCEEYADPPSSPIPILSTAECSVEGNRSYLDLTGHFGTRGSDSGQVLVLYEDQDDWDAAGVVPVDSWSDSAVRASIPNNIPYGEYRIRVRVHGIMSNVKKLVLEPPPPSGWVVGPYTPTFPLAYAYLDTQNDALYLWFGQEVGTTFPFAEIACDEPASYLQVGLPTFTGGVAVAIDADPDHWFCGDAYAPCELVFTRLELTPYGRVSGLISGELWADLDGNGEWEPYDFSGSFEDVMVVAGVRGP